MNKANPGIGIGKVVEQGVQYIIAYEGTGGVGNGGGDSVAADGICHLRNGNGGKIGGRSVLNHKFAFRLIARIVSDPSIPNIHGNALRRDGIPATG